MHIHTFFRRVIEATGVNITNIMTIHDPNWPQGCILTPKVSDSFSALFNAAPSSKTCGNVSKVALKGSTLLGPQVHIKMEHDLVTATLTISGPANVWFGVGFGASTMNDKPYAIIVDGNGKVTERKLQNHGPGTLLSNSIKGN